MRIRKTAPYRIVHSSGLDAQWSFWGVNYIRAHRLRGRNELMGEGRGALLGLAGHAAEDDAIGGILSRITP